MNVLKFILLLLLFGIFIYLVLEILRKEFQHPAWRWIWILLVTFIPIIGMLTYYFVGRKMILEKEQGI